VKPGQAVTDFNRVKPCRYGTLLYNINDQYIGRALDQYAEFSQGEVDLFEKILRPGQTVVDAGANIGAHTVFFCGAVGADGRVHAFEPQRVIFQTLCANLALNSLQNAYAYHAALGEHAAPGEQARTIKVDVPDYSRENNFGGMSLGEWTDGEDVALTCIDALDLAACDFMKIDVEGMEQAVIRGAGRAIARHRPVLYVENDRPENAAALIRQLDALGYALFWHLPPYFNPDNFACNPVNIFSNIASRNMLCLPREKRYGEFGLIAVEIPVLES
jgi:FkbM family methyltransferase